MKRFVIPLIMALGSADTLPKPSVDDLKAALNTYYIIWTVMRSFELDSVYGKHSCVYALPISLASEDYRFYYGYNDGDWWKHEILYAKLQQEGENAVLVVSETQEGKGHPHTLQYWNSNQSCFILTFTNETSGKTECQLHVWETMLRTNHSPSAYPCENEYERICGDAPKYQPYNALCNIK